MERELFQKIASQTSQVLTCKDSGHWKRENLCNVFSGPWWNVSKCSGWFQFSTETDQLVIKPGCYFSSSCSCQRCTSRTVRNYGVITTNSSSGKRGREKARRQFAFREWFSFFRTTKNSQWILFIMTLGNKDAVWFMSPELVITSAGLLPHRCALCKGWTFCRLSQEVDNSAKARCTWSAWRTPRE